MQACKSIVVQSLPGMLVCQSYLWELLLSLVLNLLQMLACGDGFSLASTADNELYFWGSRCQQPWSRLTVEDLETADDIKNSEKFVFTLHIFVMNLSWFIKFALVQWLASLTVL